MSGSTASNSTKLLQLRYNVLMAITLILGISSTVITVLASEASVRNFQIQKIQSLALIIDPQRIESLTGTGEDVNNPTYQSYKDRLVRVRQANPEIRFLYLMRLQNDQLVFLLDSEEPGSPDYSAPGDTYDEASELFKSAFLTGKTGFELDRDRWGFWMSSFAPVMNFQSGSLTAVLGADIDAYSQYFFPITRAAMLPILAFSSLILVLLINRKYMLFQTKVLEDKETILHVISHEVRTPLTKIRWASESIMEEKVFEQDVSVKSAITEIFISSIQMIQRIHNLEKATNLSDKSKIDTKAVNIGELITQSLDQFTNIAKLENVELVKDLSGIEGISQVQADSELLGLALQNIFLNMIFYADPNTKVSINSQLIKDSHQVEIVCSGWGKQMTEEELDLVFAGYPNGLKFSSHTEKTGIGLFLAKKIVSLHHGDIKIAVNDKNTVFTIGLPM